MRTAAPKDRSYLEQLNFKQLQKGKKPDGENPKVFYKKLQDEAKSGPLFDTKVLDQVEGLPELPKPVTKWIASLSIKDQLDDIKPKELGLIIDWISKSSDGAKLQSMTWDQAVKAQKDWYDAEDTEPLGSYITNEVVMRLPDGYKIVQIYDAEDLHMEGQLMQNCLQDGRYDELVKRHDSKIYSLRDSNNEPHASMEVTKGEMLQCFGKQNRKPVAQYHPYLFEFFNKHHYYEGYDLIEEEIPDNEIEHALEHGSIVTRRRIADSTNNVNALNVLSKDIDVDVLRNTATNENTPSNILKVMSENKYDVVRMKVAKHPNTTVDVLVHMSKDKDEYVRKNVASNANTPTTVLKALSKDTHGTVRISVARNKNANIDLLVMLSEDSIADVRLEVAQNVNTPIGTLNTLSTDRNDDVRWGVAKNTSTPVGVLRTLLDDSDRSVRNAAIKTLSYSGQ